MKGNNKHLRRLIIGVSIILMCIIFGVAGYMLIEHFTFSESLYMTVITLATVGFSEVHPLDDAGRIFTIILIFTNLIVFAYAITSLSSFILEGSLKDYFKTQKIQKRMEQLNQHIIVCGFGRNGKQACAELKNSGEQFVVIESQNIEADQNEFPDYIFLSGDATQDEVLLQAGLKKAKAIISSLPKDPDNIYVVLTAREMNPEIKIVSRASNEAGEQKLKRAGANHVIMPEKIGGSYMASLLLKPDIGEFISSSLNSDELEFQIREIEATQFISDGQSHTVKSLDLRKKKGLLLIGIIHSNGNYVFTPPAHTKVEATDKLIVIAKS